MSLAHDIRREELRQTAARVVATKDRAEMVKICVGLLSDLCPDVELFLSVLSATLDRAGVAISVEMEPDGKRIFKMVEHHGKSLSVRRGSGEHLLEAINNCTEWQEL